MNVEDFKDLRDCCRNEAAFDRLQNILLKAETERQQTELQSLSQLGDRVRQAFGAREQAEDLTRLEQLIAERTATLQTTSEQLQQCIIEQQWAGAMLPESEQRFRSLIENATDIIVILDEIGIFRYCSPSAKRVLGYTLQDVVGHHAGEFVHPEDVAVILQALDSAIAAPGISQSAIEYRVRHREGSWCSFEAVATSLLDDPAIRGVVINCHDITERKRAEAALRSANRQIANILERITDAFMSLDTEWRFTYLNSRAEELFQRSQSELLGQSIWDVFPGLLGSTFEQEYHRALAQQVAITFEGFYPLLNTWFEVRVFPAADGLSIFFLDVTDRQQAQAELLEMSTALGNAVEGIARLDLHGRYIGLNRAYAVALGYEQSDMIQMHWQQIVHPEDVSLIETAYQQMLTQGKAAAEVRGLRQDGSIFHQEVVLVAAYDWHDRLVGHHCFTKDITERKQAEAALRKSEERLKLTLEATQLGTWDYRPLTGSVTCSDSCERLLGLAPGRFGGTLAALLERVHPEDVDRVEQELRQPQPRSTATEFRIRLPDGSNRWLSQRSHTFYDEQGNAAVVLGVSMDITARKQAEEAQRQQAERDRLTDAIAQRIRNSLDLDAILNTTVLEVRQVLKADRVVIFQNTATGVACATAESVDGQWLSIVGKQLIDPWFVEVPDIARQKKHQVVESVEQAAFPDAGCAILNIWQVKALLVVPIVHGDRVWGLLAVHQCSAARRWETAETTLLVQLATQVAIAIQQSELYRQVQQFNAELEVQVQERTGQLRQALHYEAMLKRITDAVRDSLDERQILQTAVQELAAGLGVSSCSTGLYDLKREVSTISYESIRANAPTLQGTTIAMCKHPEIYSQLQQGQSLQFCWRVAMDAEPGSGLLPTRLSVLMHPIGSEHGVMGDLAVYKPSDRCFGDAEIRLVRQVANQCAIAIRQARLYQEAQAQVAALEELNHLKDDFLSTVSHELRTPMSNMKLAIHMLRSVTTPDRQERYLNILQTECIREIELINDLLDLQRLEAESYPVLLETLDLSTCVMELVEPFLSRIHERQQKLVLQLPPLLPTLTTDRASLERVLAELLNNACKYTSPGGEVMLEVGQLVQSSAWATDRVIFVIRNQAEIPQPELPRIFEKFYRVPGHDRWKQGGTGLGLALVQRLVMQLGGSIQAESSNSWTTFTVQLPIA